MVLLSIVDTVSPARTCWYHTILGPGVSGNRGREHPRQVTTPSQGQQRDRQPHALTSTPINKYSFGRWEDSKAPKSKV